MSSNKFLFDRKPSELEVLIFKIFSALIGVVVFWWLESQNYTWSSFRIAEGVFLGFVSLVLVYEIVREIGTRSVLHKMLVTFTLFVCLVVFIVLLFLLLYFFGI